MTAVDDTCAGRRLRIGPQAKLHTALFAAEYKPTRTLAPCTDRPPRFNTKAFLPHRQWLGSFIVLVYLLLFSTARSAMAATTIHVPADYPTIAQGLAAAQAGDTVLVAPGTYNEGELHLREAITLQGTGRHETIIDATGVNGTGVGAVLNPEPGSTVLDLTIRGSNAGNFDAAIWVRNGAVTIRRVRLTGNGNGLWAYCFDEATCQIHVILEESIIDHNVHNGVDSNELVTFTMSNNTIADNGRDGAVLKDAASSAENNLFTHNKRHGLINQVGAKGRANNAWGNEQNYVGGTSGEASNAVDPLYLNREQGDYRLHAASPVLTIGTPAGTAVGALPFVSTGEAPPQVTLTQLSEDSWQVQWDARAGIGYYLYHGPCTRTTTEIVSIDLQPADTTLTHILTGISPTEIAYVAVSSRTANGAESAVQPADGIESRCPTAPVNLQVGAFPAGEMLLQWLDTTSNEEGFHVERAVGTPYTTTHGAFEVVATLPANTTSYTETAPVIGETYWYRVKAFNANGSSSYSNESYNATFAAVPNHDERYLHVLINEARAAPGVFGYPDITPVPPLAYSALLSYATRSHSQAILNSDFNIGHCDAIGRCPGDRAAAVGYIGGGAENLVAGDDGPAAVEGAHQAFMNSETGHRENLLCACAHEVGLGHTYNPTRGGNEPWKGQYTEQFAERPDFVAPNVPSGIAIPYTGTMETEFTFIANYYHAEGAAPEKALVYIDNQPNPMSLSTGAATNGTYRTKVHMAPGEHTYYFQFSFAGGSGRWPTEGTIAIDVAGPTTIAPGDGNGDGAVDAADITACARELFDGDGTDPATAYQGSLAGTAGCDANQDGAINAGDLSCVVRLLFSGAGSCNGTTAATTTATGPAELTIGAAVPGDGDTFQVPINLTTNGNAISALSFALYPGPGFIPADGNNDDVPDAVVLGDVTAGMLFLGTWQNGRLDVALVDAGPPITPLADGTLLQLTLQNVAQPAVVFDTNVAPSLGSPSGGAIPVDVPVGGMRVFLPLVVR